MKRGHAIMERGEILTLQWMREGKEPPLNIFIVFLGIFLNKWPSSFFGIFVQSAVQAGKKKSWKDAGTHRPRN